MATADEGMDDTFSADNIIARALMNDTPSSALEEPDPHCMLSPSRVVPQGLWMVDNNVPPSGKAHIGQGTEGVNVTTNSDISYIDDATSDESGILDSLSTLAHSNSNLFILNIPNTSLTVGSGVNQHGLANHCISGANSSSLMPVLLVGGGTLPKAGTASEASLPSFLRFKDYAQANLIYATQENIAKTYNASPPPIKPATDKIIKCEECDRSFKSSGHYRYHLETHKGNRVLKCPVKGCNRRFAWPAHLKYHVRTHSNDRPYPCDVRGCHKTFYTVQSLDVHMRSHTGFKPFECPEEGCGKSFTTSGNLTNHIRTHTGEKPFVCTFEDCNIRFAEKSSLKKHRLTHTGEKPYECEICGKLFSQCSSRNAHRRRHKLDFLSGIDDQDPSTPSNLKDPDVLDLTLNHTDTGLTSTSDSNNLSVQDIIKDQDHSRLTLNQSVLEGLGSDQTNDNKSSLEESANSSESVLVLSQPHTTLTMTTNPPLNHNPGNPGDSLLCNAFLQSELEQTTSEESQDLNMADTLWHTQDE